MSGNHVVVVGGGIVGCTTAMLLRQQGWQVTVVERNVIAAQTSGEASWAGAGIIFPLLPWFYQDAVNALAMEGASLYPALADQLHRETGIDPECIRSGMMIQPPFDLEAALAWCSANHVQADLNGENLWLPEVLQVRNPRLLQALKAWLIQHQVSLKEQTQLMPLPEPEFGEQGVLKRWQTTSGETLEADIFIVTSGAWSFDLLKQTALSLEIKPMRGQMLLYQLSQPVLDHIIYRDGFYMVPRKDGYLLAGSTLEDVGFDTGVTEAMRVEMQAKAEAILPQLKDAPVVKHWSGLRPGTPHNIPTIGQHPHISNLYLNTGHFRYGVTMAPASAKRLVALVS
ncbi:NAD(P)/FAD-dependent oxidoreductase [Methylotenera sp. N17]|uniref:NAD(P)/FAD-dependent oxidoreductase n=1 Tax=Methylotenera sp. N17 TaxID=1502761 RepID=UPI000647C029|nr:FAD-dependent oxidoreductase [Methylotenera sp. N17]